MKKHLQKSIMALSILASSQALSKQENLIEYRHGVMKSVGGHMKALSMIAKEKGGEGLDAHMSFHANAMKDLAAITPDIFSFASNNPKESGSLAKIWDTKTKQLSKGFVEELNSFKAAANKAANLAKQNDISKIKPILGVLGKSCKSCHDSYKSKD